VGNIRFRWIGPLVAVALVAGAATGIAQLSDNFSNRAAPTPPHGLMSAFLSMTGGDTGHFDGPSTFKGEPRSIPLIAIDTEFNSSDFSAGCQDISFRKAVDQTTPLLFNSLNSDETITSATFTEWKAGEHPSRIFQITLSGGSAGHLISVHHVWATTTGPYDDVTLRPTGNITFTSWEETATGKLAKTSKSFTCYS
jgi:hypothetical protein